MGSEGHLWPHHSSWQDQILKPLSKGRDRTHILMDISWGRYCWATMGTPMIPGLFFKKNNDGSPCSWIRCREDLSNVSTGMLLAWAFIRQLGAEGRWREVSKEINHQEDEIPLRGKREQTRPIKPNTVRDPSCAKSPIFSLWFLSAGSSICLLFPLSTLCVLSLWESTFSLFSFMVVPEYWCLILF